jgi:hypothetical protein
VSTDAGPSAVHPARRAAHTASVLRILPITTL